ncbi:hypothetical protein RB653_000701 [Dictyostelium firmibasis]|uniref:Transcription initiation factor TFIID subunit 8 n=1 Tax=Dictyostelium firmibasis TaxID=79012 RepID=A0AAN7U6A2_9MYCE
MCDNFARVLCKIVVAQVAKNLGFTSISQIATDSLADVIQLYIQDIGIRAHEYSELSCRTDSNFFDVKQAFEDMSINIHELQQFLLQSDETPFAQVVPPFPLQGSAEQTSKPSLYKTEEQDFPLHIPSFLPSFPEKHTFSKTPLYGEVVTDPYKIKKTKNKQKRQIENSLIKLTDITTTKIPNYDMIKQQQYSKKEEASGVNNNKQNNKINNKNNENNSNNNGKSNNDNDNSDSQDKKDDDKMNLDDSKNDDDDNNELNKNNSISNGNIGNNNNNNNNNSNNNSNNNNNKKNKKTEINRDTIPPTPLESVSNTFYQKLEEEDLKKHHDEAPRRSLLSEEDQERAKKRVKCERILSLAHESSHSTINEDDKDKDIIEHD